MKRGSAWNRLEKYRTACYIYYVIDTDRYRENASAVAVLMEAGIELMRENLKRRHPAETGEKINALLGAWLHRQDDPIPGDISGSVRIRRQVP
jgi:hypothetical protein